MPGIPGGVPLRNLTQFPEEFRQAAEPLTRMIETRLKRLETANSKNLPFILEDIQLLSDGLTNLEALLGSLCQMYCDLGDKCLFLENQWRGASNIMLMLTDALDRTKREAWEGGKPIDNLQKGEVCQY